MHGREAGLGHKGIAMKNLLIGTVAAALVGIAAQAEAADLPMKAPPSPVAAAYSWTGFYIGGHVGYGFEDPTVAFAPNDANVVLAIACIAGSGFTCPPGPAAFNRNGIFGGLQTGYNWQFNRSWLLGVETDFDWSNLKGQGTNPTFAFAGGGGGLQVANFVAGEKVEWFGTLRARIGWLPVDSLLIYGTGGLAYGRIDRNVALNAASTALARSGFGYLCEFPLPLVVVNNCFSGSSSQTLVGWTVGGGLEYAVMKNVSVKAEYLYVDLGRGNPVTVVAQNGFGATPSSFSATYSDVAFHTVRVGLNFRLN